MSESMRAQEFVNACVCVCACARRVDFEICSDKCRKGQFEVYL